MTVAACRAGVFALVFGLSASAFAEEPPGSIIYALDGNLWRVPALGGSKPVSTMVSPLPFDLGGVQKLQAAGDGSSLLAVGSQRSYWLDLTGLLGEQPPLDCPGGANLDPDGTWVTCISDKGVPQFLYMRSPRQTLSLGYQAAAATRVASGQGLVVARDESVWGLRLSVAGAPVAWKERVRLAPTPAAHLLIAPGGLRAVGRFRVDGHDGLFTFALDGKGALRKLDGPLAEPIGWSIDSKWVVIQDVKRSCAVLATGGEYKCWDGFRALGVDPSARYLLLLGALGRDGKSTLYFVPLYGVRPAKPTKVFDRVITATWAGQ